jgi:cytochrome c553
MGRFAAAAVALTLSAGVFSTAHCGRNEKQTMNRGAALVEDCHTCHSPKIFGPKGPQPDPERLFSGSPATMKLPEIPGSLIAPQKWGGFFTNDLTAWVGPWGVSYGSNLTPDKETGIGNWTFDTFKDVMRTGMFHDGSRPLLPPMPTAFSALSDEDLKAMFDYFMALKPVANPVPHPIPPQKLSLDPALMK